MADELKNFSCTYRFEGLPIGITVAARSWDEVSALLRAIGMTAIVVGEQVTEVEAGIFGEGLGRATKAAQAFRKGRS